MKNTQNRNVIVWFSKEGFYFYVEGATAILNFPFPADSVRYFDVFDEVKFMNEIDAFLTQNKIDNVTAYFIVDQNAAIENYFVKNNEQVVKDFLENIPYEEVISKVSEKGDSLHAMGFNGAFYQFFASSLEKHNGIIAAVLPYLLMPETKLTAANGPVMIKKALTLKSESMIAKSTPIDDNLTLPMTKKEDKKEKSTLPYLIPVFVILIGVLAYLLLTQNK